MSFCLPRNCNSTRCEETNVFLINGKYQGPSINVCKNDVLIVDVENHIPGQSVAFHWRGQQQKNTPYMDGVPMVTQCPITSFQIFQYKFRATEEGTHLYHAFSGLHKSSGLFGSLVVNVPMPAATSDSIMRRYDSDLKEHTLIVSIFKNVHLLNGAPINLFNQNLYVKYNKNYRFRLSFIRNYDITRCDIRFSIKKHFLKIIAVDANEIVPFDVESIIMSHGERIDFILMGKLSMENGKYKLEIEVEDSCLAGKDMARGSNQNATDGPLKGSISLRTNRYQSPAGSLDYSLKHIKAARPFPEDLLSIDRLIFLPIENQVNTLSFMNHNLVETVHKIGNISFSFPLAPLLIVDKKKRNFLKSFLFCNQDSLPVRCLNEEPCNCVNLERLEVGQSVEVMFANKGECVPGACILRCFLTFPFPIADLTEDHIFHLHGHSFFVVGSAEIVQPGQSNAQLKSLSDHIPRNFDRPVIKDTIVIPRMTIILIRFIAQNPGIWLLRDENANGWTRGLDVLLHIESRNESFDIPSDFPKCENYVGPKYFLV